MYFKWIPGGITEEIFEGFFLNLKVSMNELLKYGGSFKWIIGTFSGGISVGFSEANSGGVFQEDLGEIYDVTHVRFCERFPR